MHKKRKQQQKPSHHSRRTVPKRAEEIGENNSLLSSLPSLGAESFEPEKEPEVKKKRFSLPFFSLLKRRKSSTKRSLKQKILSWQFLLFSFIVLSIGIVLTLIVLFFKDLPSPTKLRENAYPVSSKIFDRNGNILYEIYADQNRTPIKLKDLPPYVYQASIAIEDQRFYKHFGFDFEGIVRALRNIIFKQQLQGGSTITQQLVKTTLLTRKRTLSRKAKEAVLTVMTEALYTKDEILEMYLNHIPYGGTAYGIESASKTYFNKSAKDLSVAEAALLAGLPQAPSAYSPFGSKPERGTARQKEVLRRMVEEKYITKEKSEEAAKQELKFATDKINIKAPHFVFYVKDMLEDKYSASVVEQGGLRVTTTLDLSIQEKAQATVSAEIDKLKRYKVGNGAALVTNPKTGEILAMVGSKNYFDASADGQVNVTIRERQPGSSIKPLNYVTAMELGKITPSTMMLDIPTCFQVDGQPLYCPKNYDGSFKGPTQTRFALGNSNNIIAVKTLALNGVDNFIATASAMGIKTWKDPSRYGLSLTLGGGEVTMLDLATAYGTLANQGVRVNLNPILKVEDYTGKVLEEHTPSEIANLVDDTNAENASPSAKFDWSLPVERVLHRANAYLISHILLDNNARIGAFGPSSQLVIPRQIVSVKTGTTNDLRDNWTIGYTPSLLTAVWVGNNDNSPMNRSLVSGVTGAAPIWNGIMKELLKGKKEEWPEKPEDVVSENVCTLSGLIPNSTSPCTTRSEFFWKETVPREVESVAKDTWISPTTGLPPKEGDPSDGLLLEKRLFLTDPFVFEFCLDCNRAVSTESGTPAYERTIVPVGKKKINN